jgi:hypothetical protein
MLRAALKEPLIHFLVVGVLLFAFYDLRGGSPEPNDRRIVVTRERIQQLASTWAKQWQRPPTEDELRALVEQFTREEVLYREALAMGLDEDDTIIRRRMAQKVEFLVQDLAAQRQPEPADLTAFFEKNADLFREPARLSFSHVYFSTDRRGSAAAQDARELRDRLNGENASEAAAHGDPFLLRDTYRMTTRRDVAADFGAAFADAVFDLEVGAWHGPVRSGYGLHLVRVSERVEATLPAFAAVRDRVEQAYVDEERRRTNEEVMRRMMERYEVVIDDGARADAGASSRGVDE